MRGNDRLDVLGPERLDVGLVEFQCSEALDRHRALVRGHSTFRPVAHNSDLDLTEDPVVAYRKEGDGLALPHPTGAGAREAQTPWVTVYHPWRISRRACQRRISMNSRSASYCSRISSTVVPVKKR